ncbi:MAG TPA: hypothetical protein VFO05_15765 [Candidatus Limnocylindrales bacterium]|nr:hypothetical protein [Candidatus Limnocylindrales bacterium]
MTASEFAFLALGLLLGVASGAALIEVLRSRPPSRREIRVTVAPNSIPRRAATLTEAELSGRGPARGGPADRRWVDRDMPPADEPLGPASGPAVPSPIDPVLPPPGPPEIRTPVPSMALGASFRVAHAGSAGGTIALTSGGPVGIAIQREPDPMVAALRATAAATAAAAIRRRDVRGGVATLNAETAPRAARATGMATAAEISIAPAATAEAESAGEGESAAGPGPAAPSPAAGGGPEATPDDACADQRRVADERCAVAARAREGAETALDALRTNQRSYDDLVTRAEAEAAAADPRAVRAAKEAAQHAFRRARASGRTRDDVEAAARDWLTEINRINHETREASASAERHRGAAAEIAVNLERLSVEADAARISAESAEEACVAAREAVAACQEAAILAAAGGASAPSEIIPPPAGRMVPDDDAVQTPMGSRAGEDAAIIRMLRGDREVTDRIVARLAGDDPEARRLWQIRIGDLLEALIARAIEAAAFDFPADHSFWSPFTRSQSRDIMGALASLGYRHDGFGGWADERVPSQRDLSLAVGYAGLDPMRIRRWPSESEMPDLLRDVAVAADEYVWEAAGGLTLGELVSLLGRRADGLAEVWNEWGAVRPMLLSAD